MHLIKTRPEASVTAQVDLDALRELAWSGVPPQLRSMCWRLLLGYLPPSTERRSAATPPCFA